MHCRVRSLHNSSLNRSKEKNPAPPNQATLRPIDINVLGDWSNWRYYLQNLVLVLSSNSSWYFGLFYHSTLLVYLISIQFIFKDISFKIAINWNSEQIYVDEIIVYGLIGEFLSIFSQQNVIYHAQNIWKVFFLFAYSIAN